MRITGLIVLLFLTAVPFKGITQKQLVFLKHGKVVARFTEGGSFKFILKNHKQKEGFIVELRDFSMITSNDTIAFLSIAKIHRRDHQGVNVTSGFGGFLFVGGLGYVAIHQINNALGYTNNGFEQGDKVSLIIGSIGAAMLFIKPRYQRIRPGTIMRTVDYRSPYYLFNK